MSLTVRLGPKAERTLNALARRHRQSRSDIVRQALARYEASATPRDDTGRPYDAWVDVIGVIKVGARQAQCTTGDQFTEIVGEKARARRAR